MIDQSALRKRFQERYGERIIVLDSHTGGEPTRLIVGGIGPLPGSTMKEKRLAFEEQYDHIRQLLTKEPRGHRGMFAACVTEPVTPEAQFGLIYMDPRRYPFLCGHATIGAVTCLIETGVIPYSSDVVDVAVDTPSGIMHTKAFMKSDKVESVAFRSVPSFVYETDRELTVPGWGKLKVATVCVGGFFAMVASDQLNMDLKAENSAQLIELGMAIIASANEQLTVRHPERPEVTTVDVTEFYETATARDQGAGVVIYGESHMDRSPCGTGTTAKLALFHHLGKIQTNQPYRNEGPLGTAFGAFVAEDTRVGDLPAVVVEIRGSAYLTGLHEFVIDPADPFDRGYLL
jgi:proline racemase